MPSAPARSIATTIESVASRRSSILARACAGARSAPRGRRGTWEILDVLFETARVDPELLLRNEALRAMSQILRSETAKPRAAEHVNRLRDLWNSGDDAVREDVAVAWALSPVFESGGREALGVALASGKGPGALAAAGVVLRSASKDTELAGSASALLSPDDRRGLTPRSAPCAGDRSSGR